MQERNFEKQVRSKMEELSITPSRPVWQKVEAEIKAKKDKRRVIFWLLPLLATGLFAGWWFWPSDMKTATHQTAINETHTSPQTNTTTETVTSSQTPLNNTLANQQTGNRTTNTKTDNTNNSTAASINSTSSKTIIVQKRAYPHSSNNIAIANNHYPQSTGDITLNGITEPVPNDISMMDANPVSTIPVAVLHIPVTDSILQLKPAHLISIKDAPPILTANKRSKKWQWSLYGAVGASGISSDLLDALSLNKSIIAVPMYASTPSYSNTYPLLQIRPSTPAPVTQGLSFSAGIDLKKAISKKAYIVTGLHYAYYSTQTEIGQKISNLIFNSSIQLNAVARYRNTSHRYPYTNQYHFIEVPVSVYYQLLKRKPLYIHTGISAGQLLSTNALYYDPKADVYYQSKQRLNKTQLNWMAGITYDFAIGKHLSLSAGPEIQYGLRPIQKTTNKPHLFATGIRMNILVK